ncbi:MAG: hypothetical protein ABI690_15305 [Chloroflexota bacterium]
MSTNYWDEFWKSYELRTNNAPESVRAMMLARERAALAGNAEAVLFMNHWILQTLIFHVEDLKTAYDLAVKTAIEARKPQYAHMQEHICTQQDLILTYLGMDPEGHEHLIDEAIKFMAQEITGPMQCRFCLQELRCSFEVARGKIDDAQAETNRYLSMADEATSSSHKRHHKTVAYASMCDVAYRQQDWTLLLNSALQGELLSAGEDQHVERHAYFVACQALAQRKLGAEDQANLAYRRATMQASEITGMTLPRGFYDTLCLYNEATGAWDAALKLRDRQLAEIADKGQPYWESRVRLERIRLLKALGQPIADDAAATRPVIGRLKRSDKFTAELDRLTAS